MHVAHEALTLSDPPVRDAVHHKKLPLDRLLMASKGLLAHKQTTTAQFPQCKPNALHMKLVPTSIARLACCHVARVNTLQIPNEPQLLSF